MAEPVEAISETTHAPRHRLPGLDAPEAELAVSFALAAKFPLVKGSAVGRTTSASAAQAWIRMSKGR